MGKSQNELQNENKALTQQLITCDKKVQELSNQSDPKYTRIKKITSDVKRHVNLCIATR